MTTLLWFHAAGLPLYALWRGFSPLHSAAEGGVLAVLTLLASVPFIPLRARAAISALGLITSSAILVHFSGGLIEAHFHFFVIVLILSLYEDWVPFLIAVGYVVLHHGIVGQLSPELVYNHADALANPWKWAVVHSGFVAAAAVGAVVSWRSNENARARAAEASAHAAQAAEANELKSRFVATASHELRTPLTSIAGFTSTLLHRWEETRESDKLRMLEIVEAQSTRLRSLIENLLVLSSVESGALVVRSAEVDVAAAVEGVVGAGDGGELTVDVPPGCIARVDEHHLELILANLVANARSYGALPVDIRARAGGSWVTIDVADHGGGISDELLPDLFTAFSREGEYATNEGTGLGLSIVRGLAQANGGDVTYRANRPHGARFSVRLPQG